MGSWAPHGFATPEPDLYARIAALNQGDSLLGPAIAEGLRERGFSAGVLGDMQTAGSPAGDRNAFPALAGAAGEMLRAADGPRIAALEIGGWDTHAAQTPRLASALHQLDAGLAALKTGLGEAWRQTAVLAMTEFGRTVRVNGTKGTDHGTGTVAFVLGGAVAGGRVVADWPGLGDRPAAGGSRPAADRATCGRSPRGCWRAVDCSASSGSRAAGLTPSRVPRSARPAGRDDRGLIRA